MRALHDNPLALLFAVSALGYLLGHVKFAGVSPGVAAVLFVGLAASAFDPALVLPEVVPSLGLVLFVYAIGLQSGPSFFEALRRQGVRDASLTAGVLGVGALLTVLFAKLFHLPAARAVGVFAGALTNTPALAEVSERLKEHGGVALAAEPVVAYSVTYPAGVLGVLIALALMQRWFAEHPRASMPPEPPETGLLESRTLCIAEKADGVLLEPLREQRNWHVVFARVQRGDEQFLAGAETVVRKGDLVSVVGPPSEFADVAEALGTLSDAHLELDRSVIDFRRIFVSDHEVVGRPLASLELHKKFGALVTRIRRGDVEMLPDDETHLELGDRVRVVAPREKLKELAKYFGDSYRAISEIDVRTFGLGIALGLLLGKLALPLPGGLSLRLGTAGGPLLVGLVLGRLGHTGPFTWSMPYGAGLTVRQLGIVIFLAGVGTRSGQALANTLRTGGAMPLFVAGAVVTCVVAFSTLWIGHRMLKVPLTVLAGMLAGIHTQPAVLAFAVEQARSDRPNLGYAAVFPLATIGKIVLAQVLLLVLTRC